MRVQGATCVGLMLLSRLRPNAASFLRALSCSGAAGGRMPVWVLRMTKGAALKLRPVAEVEGRAAD